MFSFFTRAENAAGLIGLHSENRWALRCARVRTSDLFTRARNTSSSDRIRQKSWSQSADLSPSYALRIANARGNVARRVRIDLRRSRKNLVRFSAENRSLLSLSLSLSLSLLNSSLGKSWWNSEFADRTSRLLAVLPFALLSICMLAEMYHRRQGLSRYG